MFDGVFLPDYMFELCKAMFDCWFWNLWLRWTVFGCLDMMQSDLGKLFIGGISWDTDEERLKEYFSGYGEVLETVIMKDRTTGRARGFGFIVFADPAVADLVIQERHNIDGRMVNWYIKYIFTFMLANLASRIVSKKENGILINYHWIWIRIKFNCHGCMIKLE